ncbi:MAG: 30S ribosomal protein S15 [Candidatus Aenigmatarchaeota archaeon]
MARMYSRKRGKSGSHMPRQKIAPWVKYKPKEVEDIILKLAKAGNQSAQIGLILRDQYGIPSVRLSKLKIARVMKKAGVYPELPEDMSNMIKKAVLLDAHMTKNKKDYTSKRGLELTESKIRRLARYYKKKGALPADWKWNMARAKLLVK